MLPFSYFGAVCHYMQCDEFTLFPQTSVSYHVRMITQNCNIFAGRPAAHSRIVSHRFWFDIMSIRERGRTEWWMVRRLRKETGNLLFILYGFNFLSVFRLMYNESLIWLFVRDKFYLKNYCFPANVSCLRDFPWPAEQKLCVARGRNASVRLLSIKVARDQIEHLAI